MSELRLQIRSQEALREQWNRSLRYGALMGAIEPIPTVGASVTVAIVPSWGGPNVVVNGTVLEATAVASVVQLDGLSEQAVAALQALGIAEAGASVSEKSNSSSEPETTVSPPPPEGAFAPVAQGGGLAPPPQGAFGHASQGASSEAPPAAPTAVEVDSKTIVDLADPRQITGVSQAGTPAAVALLPEPSHEGDFGSSSWRDTLLSLLEGRATGVLVIRALREMRWCYLVDGEPVHYLGDQPHPGEFLSDMLIADGLVTRESRLDAAIS